MDYNFTKIQAAAREIWKKTGVFKTSDDFNKPKFYVLDMFPYPSGDGLHVGHPKGYSATDVVANFKRLKGYNVLHPMGWDAFGLPAENYAIKVKKNPKEVVAQNIKNFKKQLEQIGFSYDWDREINTTDPEYYKWTQWIFIKLFEKGLAYEEEAPINFCPSCKTGIANEEVESGLCARCGTKVERKKLRQWILKITAYAEKLLETLDDLDWPESIKLMQKNWIGKSTGTNVIFKLNTGDDVTVFTTRVDTLYGCTYMVLAPEHPLVEKYKDKIENYSDVAEYIDSVKSKSDLERTEIVKEKTGIELKGINAINPINNQKIPVFIADYVLANYGTGAVMAVPAHDERDFEFAEKYNLAIVPTVIKSSDYYSSYLMGADEVSDQELLNLKIKIIEKLDSGSRKIEIPKESINEYEDLITNKLRNGFWNEYIGKKIVFIFKHNDGKTERLQYDKNTRQKINQLTADFSNDDSGRTIIEDWLREGADGFYKKNLLSTEYGILIDSEEFDGLTSQEAKEKITEKLKLKGQGDFSVNYKLRDWIFSRQRYWGEPIPIIHCEKCGAVPVDEKDLPVILPEVESYEPTGDGNSPLAKIHKWVNTTCPKCGGPGKRETNTMPQWAGSCWYYLRFADPKNNNALISKEKDNYFLPVDLYVGGAEHAVLHLLYARFWHKFLFDIGCVKDNEPFKKLQNVGLILAPDRQKMSKSRGNVISPDDIVTKYGADAFKMYEMFIGPFDQPALWSLSGVSGTYKFLEKVAGLFEFSEYEDKQIENKLNYLVKSIEQKIEKMYFNTAVSDYMKFSNQVDLKIMTKDQWRKFLITLTPFAPHLAEYLYSQLELKESIFQEKWVEVQATSKSENNYVIQINGKKVDLIVVEDNISEDEIISKAESNEKVIKRLEGQTIKKKIFIQDKLINFVV